MNLRETRLAPLSLRRALRMLGPLGLLCSLVLTGLLGLLAQSASADHKPDPPTLTATPGEYGTTTSPSWSFTLPKDHTATCTLSGPSGGVAVSCPTTGGTASPASPLATDGAYTFSVTSTRPDTEETTGSETPTVTIHPGGTSDPATHTYTLDRVAPVLTVTPPASGVPYSSTSGWQIAVSDGGSPVTLTCQLTGGQPFSCAAGAVKPTLTADGVYTLTVNGSDAAGNAAAEASASYTYDGTAPVVRLTRVTASPSSVQQPVWDITVDDGTVSCVLTGPTGEVIAGGSCGPTRYTAPVLSASGTYTLTVRSTDDTGNVGSATSTYTLDRTPPVIGISGPDRGKADTVTWTVTVSDASTVSCSVSGADISTAGCSATGGTVSATRTTDGTVHLTVSATDEHGNSATATAAYARDTTVQFTIVAPAGPSSNRTPTWTYSSPETVTIVGCELLADGAVVSPAITCGGSSYTSSELPPTAGTSYLLRMTVRDDLGNEQVFTSSPAYRLDTVLELTVTGPSGPSPDRLPTWTFTGETYATVTCTLTGPTGAVLSGGTCGQTGYAAPRLPADGVYTLTVVATDPAGNSATRTATYELDTLHLTVNGPTGPSPVRTPTWSFTDEPYRSADCRLTTTAGTVVYDGRCTTTSSFTAPELPLTAGTDYVLTVTVVDSIGNKGSFTTVPYRLDTQLPAATITVPAGPSRQVTVAWTVAADEALSSASCRLRRDGTVVLSLTSCPGTTTVSLPGDGRYDLVVTLVDLAGNSSTTTSTVLVHDATIPPAPVVSPSTTTTNRTTATWTISAEAGTVTTCRVLREGAVFRDWAPCGATFSLPLAGDGTYTLEVVSTDPVGPGPVTTATYLLDTVAPSAPRPSGPTGPAQSRTPTWTVGTDAGTTVECRLVRGATVIADWSSCGGTFAADLTGLPDGAYVLQARATDAAGNLSAIGGSVPYVLDTTAPTAPVLEGPAGPAQLRTPRFTWTGETGAAAQCQLSRDGVLVGGWVACTSGYAPVLDRDGTWTLMVRLTDAAGNLGEAGASGGYVLDTTAPGAPLVTPPKTPGRDLAPSWGAVVEGGTALECRLTGPGGVSTGWTACTLPHVTPLTGRPDGAYLLEVRATDVAGNVSAIGSATYVLDTVAPAAAVVVSPAGPGRTRTPTFTFTTEPEAGTRCRLTSGATLLSDFAACTSPVGLDLTGLPDGTYTLTVRVTDAAGNPGPAATGTYVLDTTPPAAPVFTSSPATPSSARSVTWSFSAEPGTGLVCRLTFPTGAVREIAGCASPLTIDLNGLPDGSYTLTVRAVDAAGNVGLAATAVHVVDSTALAAPEVTGPTGPSRLRTPSWRITATGVTECRLTRGTTVLRDWAVCSGGYTADLFGQPDGTYTLQVRAKDAAGAVSAATLSRYLLDTTAPGLATLVAPPTPSTNRVPTWSISSPEPGATAMCQVLVFSSVLRPWAPCAVSAAGALHSVDLTGLGDGSYTLQVRLTDAAGNVGETIATSTYVLDTAAPVAVGVTGPPSPGNEVNPTWRLSTAGSTPLECRLTSAAGVVSDWAPCADTYTADLSEQPDGTYTLAVRAVSEAGTPGPETTSAYVLATAAPGAPTALVLSGVLPRDNDRAPAWTFTLPPGTTGLCKVVQGTRVVVPEGPCSSPFRLDLSSAADGTYTLTVWAVDAAGNRTAAAPSSYVLVTVPPEQPVLTQMPGATGSTLDPQWRFTVVRIASAECRLLYGGSPVQGSDWTACAGVFTASLTGRPDGLYTLQVRAVDAAGNTSAPVANDYLLDRTAAPVVTFTATPPAVGSDSTVAWTLGAPEGTALECRLVAPDRTTAWAPCDAAAGLRATTVRAGTTGGTYRLDLTGRPDGEYVLEVRVVEPDGRRGAVSRASYLYDTRPPSPPRFSDPPPLAGNAAEPSWLWDASGSELVECRLVRVGAGEVVGWRECSDGGYTASLGRTEGTYVLELRRTDAAGNVSAVAGAAYRYDITPPTAPEFTSRPPAGGSSRSVSWTFVVAPGDRATCRVTRESVVVRADQPCTGRYDLDLSNLPDGTYTLTVRYTDAAGNVSRPTSGTYTLATLRAGGPVRLDPPFSPSPRDPVLPGGGTTAPPPPPQSPAGPGRTGTGATGPVGSVRPDALAGPLRPVVPALLGDRDVVRSSEQRPSTPQSGATGQGQTAGGSQEPDPAPSSVHPLLPRDFGNEVPEVIRDVALGTIKRPTLPLALLVIVVLFLLAQNRIDRRDPKLSNAPVEAEPELDFSFYVQRPRGALS